MKINAKQFLDAALPALKYADSNPIIFITGAVLISPVENDATKVTVTACNSHGSLKCTAPVLFPLVNPICLMGADLIKVLSVFSGETTINVKKSTAEIKCGTSKYEVPLQPASDFPKTENYADEVALQISASDLKEVVSVLNALSSHYDHRPQASGLFFFDETAFAWHAEEKSMGAAHVVKGITTPFVIPHHAVPHLLNSIKSVDANEDCTIARNDAHYLTIGIGDVVLNVVPNTGNPDISTFQQFLPFLKQQASIYFDVDADAFKAALVRASVFGSTYVKIDFDASNVIVNGYETNMSESDLSKSSQALCPLLRIDMSKKDAKSVPPYCFLTKRIIAGMEKMQGETRVNICSNGALYSTGRDKQIIFIMQQTIFK